MRKYASLLNVIMAAIFCPDAFREITEKGVLLVNAVTLESSVIWDVSLCRHLLYSAGIAAGTWKL